MADVPVFLTIMAVFTRWVVATPMVPVQTQDFLDEFLGSSLHKVKGDLPLPSFNYSTAGTDFAAFQVLAEGSGGSASGPSSLVVVGQPNGAQLPSGSAYVEATLHLGQLKMGYKNLKLRTLGFGYEGPVSWGLENSESRLKVEVRRTTFRSCEIRLSLERPRGTFVLLPGDQPGIQEGLAFLTETYLRETHATAYREIQRDLNSWTLFAPVYKRLEDALEDTASQMFCKDKNII